MSQISGCSRGYYPMTLSFSEGEPLVKGPTQSEIPYSSVHWGISGEEPPAYFIDLDPIELVFFVHYNKTTTLNTLWIFQTISPEANSLVVKIHKTYLKIQNCSDTIQALVYYDKILTRLKTLEEMSCLENSTELQKFILKIKEDYAFTQMEKMQIEAVESPKTYNNPLSFAKISNIYKQLAAMHRMANNISLADSLDGKALEIESQIKKEPK